MIAATSLRKMLVPLAFLVFAAGAGAAEPSADAYNLDTPIGAIAAQPAGAAIINKDIPGLLSNANYDDFKALSLRQVGVLSGGRLTHEMLVRTEADLAALQTGPAKASVRHVHLIKDS